MKRGSSSSPPPGHSKLKLSCPSCAKSKSGICKSCQEKMKGKNFANPHQYAETSHHDPGDTSMSTATVAQPSTAAKPPAMANSKCKPKPPKFVVTPKSPASSSTKSKKTVSKLNARSNLPALMIIKSERNVPKSAAKEQTSENLPISTSTTISTTAVVSGAAYKPLLTSAFASTVAQATSEPFASINVLPTPAIKAEPNLSFISAQPKPATTKSFVQDTSTTVATLPLTSTPEATSRQGSINIGQIQKELKQILSSLSATLNTTLSSVNNLSSKLQSIDEPTQNLLPVPMPRSTGVTGLCLNEPTRTTTLPIHQLIHQPVHQTAPIATVSEAPVMTTVSSMFPKQQVRFNITSPSQSHSIAVQTSPTTATSPKVITSPATSALRLLPASSSIRMQALPKTRPPIKKVSSHETGCSSSHTTSNPTMNILPSPAIASASGISLKTMMKEAISNIHIDLHITKCGISGPPGTGKTHFRKLLLGKKRPTNRKSTNLSTKADEIIPEDIVIAPALQQPAQAFKWTELKDEPWLRLLTNTVFEHLRKKHNIEDLNIESEIIARDRLDFGTKVYLSVFNTIKETKGKKKVKRRTLHKINLIYLVDTGGQPQFQEILPHFVQSSVHLLVHNLTQELSESPDFQYTVDDVQYTVPETLKASNISMIDQTVRSACSCIREDRGRPHVAIIGTFKDKFNEVGINGVLRQKSEAIKTKLRPYMDCKPTMKCDMIECSKDHTIFPIDASEFGWNSNGKVLENIKSKINELGERSSSTKVHINYFIFLQNLKCKGKEKPYIKMSECKKIAYEGFIALSDEEIQEALHLFNDVNLILHFPDISEVKDIIFLDPTFLYERITRLIVKSFNSSRSTSAQSIVFRHTGVFKKELLYDILDILDSQFTIDMFLSILKELYIISEIEGSYFMPCVLQVEDPNSLSPSCQEQLEGIKNYMNMNSIGGPLYISFGDRISPRGLFCAMVVILSKRFGWKLNSDYNRIRRRNIIEFRVMCTTNISEGLPSATCIGTAVIFDKSSHLEVYTTCPKSYCSEVRCAIAWSLNVACKTLKYRIADFGVEQGFQCELCLNNSSQHHTIVSKNTKKELVHKCSKNSRQHGIRLNDHQRVWFQGNAQDSSDMEVGISDVSKIAEELIHRTNLWYMIGLNLHLSINDLEKIQIDNYNEDTRFLKVLEKWKRNGDPSFTWNTIRDVLLSNLVQENALAKEIEEKYINNS